MAVDTSYPYVTGKEKIVIDGNILPLRHDTYPSYGSTIRGEDVVFMLNAANYRLTCIDRSAEVPTTAFSKSITADQLERLREQLYLFYSSSYSYYHDKLFLSAAPIEVFTKDRDTFFGWNGRRLMPQHFRSESPIGEGDRFESEKLWNLFFDLQLARYAGLPIGWPTLMTKDLFAQQYTTRVGDASIDLSGGGATMQYASLSSHVSSVSGYDAWWLPERTVQMSVGYDCIDPNADDTDISLMMTMEIDYSYSDTSGKSSDGRRYAIIKLMDVEKSADQRVSITRNLLISKLNEMFRKTFGDMNWRYVPLPDGKATGFNAIFRLVECFAVANVEAGTKWD